MGRGGDPTTSRFGRFFSAQGGNSAKVLAKVFAKVFANAEGVLGEHGTPLCAQGRTTILGG